MEDIGLYVFIVGLSLLLVISIILNYQNTKEIDKLRKYNKDASDYLKKTKAKDKLNNCECNR